MCLHHDEIVYILELKLVFFSSRLLLLEKGHQDVNTLSQILTETCAALTYPLGKYLTVSLRSALISLNMRRFHHVTNFYSVQKIKVTHL